MLFRSRLLEEAVEGKGTLRDAIAALSEEDTRMGRGEAGSCWSRGLGLGPLLASRRHLDEIVRGVKGEESARVHGWASGEGDEKATAVRWPEEGVALVPLVPLVALWPELGSLGKGGGQLAGLLTFDLLPPPDTRSPLLRSCFHSRVLLQIAPYCSSPHPLHAQ